MALQGKVCLVTGATGIVGEGIAKAFSEAGAQVIAPVRTPSKEAALRAAVGGPPPDKLDAPAADYSTSEGSKQLARYVQLKYGGVVRLAAFTDNAFTSQVLRRLHSYSASPR